VRYNFTRLRYAGAAMRHMLETAAAQHWGVAAEQCRGVQHAVVHAASGRRIGYGEIASAAAVLSVPSQEAVTLKDRRTWRLIGKAVPSLTVPKIIRGAGTFGIDVPLPEMLHAVIARPPQVFGSVNTVDDRATLQVPGVVRTVRLDSPQPSAAFKALGGVAVIARDTWSAIRGREALTVTWNQGPHADYESDAFAQTLLSRSRALRPSSPPRRGVMRRTICSSSSARPV
jgi:isoquinoline 1-oxidoreductase beta subunit